MEPDEPPSAPPGAWPAAHRLARRFAMPVEQFLRVQAASGIVLLAAAAVALGWANLPGSDSYEHFWHQPVVIGIGDYLSRRTLHFWVNDALMTLFFFVVGLEVRREIYHGELSELRRAALPFAAALGGMLVPAAIYLLINKGTSADRGWGVPMATDIAFAVGVLALLGTRVPPALRVLLLALAIIDDIGAIVVIAVFYANGFSMSGIAIAGLGVTLILALQRFGARNPWLYVPPAAVVWAGVLAAGVHPTIAGVVVGLLTPARSWFGARGFVAVAATALDQVQERIATDSEDSDSLKEPLSAISAAQREVLAPATRLEAALHPWVAFGIMPLFALANAGVNVRSAGGAGTETAGVMVGIIAGLLIGKPVGVVLASVAVVKLGWASLPRAVTWSGVVLVGCVAAIGFTMAIFVSGLAFEGTPLLGTSKLAVLLASGAAIAISMLVGRLLLRGPVLDGARTVHEAETSTES